MTVTDHTLLDGVAAGDQAALAQLYNAYRARLWRYLWLHAGLVEEALQGVFVSVWRTAGAVVTHWAGEGGADDATVAPGSPSPPQWRGGQGVRTSRSPT
ncbi:MAG TPA: hypothetical protein VJN88_14735 [Ktedonobacterales bacterium]|nr:hypothetical protein [Ktedonobacterales bacterium]